MDKSFSKSWISSKKPRKQRKYILNAPQHIKSKMFSSHLSKELRAKHGKRSMRPVKGDKVKIMRGKYKGQSGKIEKVDVNDQRALISGIEFIKKDGNKVMYPIHVSNLTITELNLTDKKRKAIVERKTKK